jgi:hypothetical protein
VQLLDTQYRCATRHFEAVSLRFVKLDAPSLSCVTVELPAVCCGCCLRRLVVSAMG